MIVPNAEDGHLMSMLRSTLRDVDNDKADIKTAQVDDDDVEQLKEFFNSFKSELVINLALPYQDLTIMYQCVHV